MAKWWVGFLIVFVVIVGQQIQADKEDAKRDEERCIAGGGEMKSDDRNLVKRCEKKPEVKKPEVSFFK